MLDRRTLPLSSLRSFEAVAEHLHMGKAAEDLGVTPGAVSHQVRQLETRLGVQLFSRAHNSLSLTPAGARLYSSVSDGLNRILEGTRRLDPETLSGPLVVGCTQTIASSWAINHICDFFREYPTIEITLREIASREKNIPHDIDVAICYGAPNADERRLTKLGAPLLYPVASPTLLSKGNERLRPSDIAQFTLLHDSQVSWSKWMEKHDVDPGTATSNIYFSNALQAQRAARLGAGVALSNTLEAQDYIKDGRLVRLMEKSIDEEHSYYLLSPRPENETIKSQVFSEWISKACKPE